jgi:RNA polymerase sigma-70 factor (ECF subfamily)
VDTTSDPASAAQVEDHELVLRAQAGDAAAMAQLLARHYDYVRALCRRSLRNSQDAEDAAQEALFLATRNIATFSGRSAFRTWLHAITRNVCLNSIRANNKRRHDDSLDDLYEDEQPPNRRGAFRDADSVVDQLQIEAALAALPKNVHDAVVLRFVHDLEYSQIAEVLDVPLGTVKTWLRRGRAELMSTIGETAQGGRGV